MGKKKYSYSEKEWERRVMVAKAINTVVQQNPGIYGLERPEVTPEMPAKQLADGGHIYHIGVGAHILMARYDPPVNTDKTHTERCVIVYDIVASDMQMKLVLTPTYSKKYSQDDN